MSSRRLLVLMVVAALAVAAFVTIELPQRRTEERSRADATRLFALDPRDIDAIVLERPDAQLRFRLTGTHWTMESPVVDDGEAAAIVPIFSTIAEAEVMRDLGPADDPARYGLAPPSVRLTLLAAGDTLAALELGSPVVDHSAIYARRSDGRVLLVPTAIQRAATLPPDEYRNRRVLVFDLSTVRAFEIASQVTGASAWRRAAGDAWFTVVAGDTVRGDSVAVPSVLRRLRGMRVRSFVANADTSASPPLVTVTMHGDDGSSRTVRFSAGPAGSFQARVSGNPRTVEIADDPTDIADESVLSLRDRRVLQFDPVAALRITVATADTSAVLVRAGTAWALANPALGSVDPERAADFVRALRALRFTRPAPEGAMDPRQHARFSLVVYGAGDTIIDELHCAPAPGGDGVWLVRSHSLGALFEIDPAALDTIARRLARVRR